MKLHLTHYGSVGPYGEVTSFVSGSMIMTSYEAIPLDERTMLIVACINGGWFAEDAYIHDDGTYYSNVADIATWSVPLPSRFEAIEYIMRDYVPAYPTHEDIPF